MYSTRTRVHARIPNGHPREEKRARRTKVRGQVGEDRRACPARGELNGPRAPRQADFHARRTRRRRLPREDPRAKVGEEVRVGVGVRVGPMEFKLNQLPSNLYQYCICCQSAIKFVWILVRVLVIPQVHPTTPQPRGRC